MPGVTNHMVFSVFCKMKFEILYEFLSLALLGVNGQMG